jgi:hypothetical protein
MQVPSDLSVTLPGINLRDAALINAKVGSDIMLVLSGAQPVPDDFYLCRREADAPITIICHAILLAGTDLRLDGPTAMAQ